MNKIITDFMGSFGVSRPLLLHTNSTSECLAAHENQHRRNDGMNQFVKTNKKLCILG